MRLDLAYYAQWEQRARVCPLALYGLMTRLGAVRTAPGVRLPTTGTYLPTQGSAYQIGVHKILSKGAILMVYLIHLERPLAHSQHYIGFVDAEKGYTVEARLAKHRKGPGSPMLRAATRNGIAFDVVRVWPNATRTDERKLKNRKRARCLCPICLKGV